MSIQKGVILSLLLAIFHILLSNLSKLLRRKLLLTINRIIRKMTLKLLSINSPSLLILFNFLLKDSLKSSKNFFFSQRVHQIHHISIAINFSHLIAYFRETNLQTQFVQNEGFFHQSHMIIKGQEQPIKHFKTGFC